MIEMCQILELCIREEMIVQERRWEGGVYLAGGELDEGGQGEGEMRDLGLEVGI